MKKYLKFLAMMLLCGFMAQSCESGAEESDTTPDVDNGGGDSSDDSGEANAPNLIAVNPGYMQAEVVWLINGSESDVKYCYVYYENTETGKVSESLQSAAKSTDTLRTYIPMSEGNYNVTVKNYYDSKAEYSDASESASVSVYGDTYKETIVSCEAEVTYTAAEGGAIVWGDVEVEGFIGNSITYTNKSGEEISLFSDASQSEITFDDVTGGVEVAYRTLYLPSENAVDTLSASEVVTYFPLDPDEQVVVSSLKALMPYLKMDNANVKLTPGTYYVNEVGFSTGEYGSTFDVVEGTFKLYLINVEGSNGYFDFTDVEIQIDTDVFKNLSVWNEFVNLSVTGDNNVVTGLTLRDVTPDGDIEFRNGGCTNVIMDGYNNKFEYITVYSTGSYPYGYGECFGKGGTDVTIIHDKHCSFLIRGTKSHAYRCYVTHYAYGHCMFMQAADQTLIEECVIQSEMTTTDTILAEEGTGSAADNVDFLTTWGWRLQSGYTLACSEEGIRAYGSGNTISMGVRAERGTSNPTIKNCYVKTARSGVTLTHATGTKYVEGTTTIGCDRGFCIGSGDIVGCFADCTYGPAFGVDYASDSGVTADITLLPNELPELSGNGSQHAAFIIGKNHNLTFKNYDGNSGTVPTYNTTPVDDGAVGSYATVSEPYYDPKQPKLVIQVGGDNRTIGEVEEEDNYTASGITITNETGYRIIMDNNASGCTVSTVGKYENYGSSNTMKSGTNDYGRTPQPVGDGTPYAADGTSLKGGVNNFEDTYGYYTE